MLERILIAGLLALAGIVAYRALLFWQKRRADARAKLAHSRLPMLLVFSSPTCAPCKLQQIPIVDKLMPEWQDKIDALIVDVTQQPDIATQYGVWSLPTTIVVDASQNVIAINHGVADERTLREQFATAIYQLGARTKPNTRI